MHFELLVEDRSGKKSLDILVPKIIGDQHTFRVHSYKGIGRIPKKLGTSGNASYRMLLEQLPRLLRGYGKAFANYPEAYSAAVVLVCDLDDKCLKRFRNKLLEILNSCDSKPLTRFCIAIEESEAWLLGDISAIKKAYPKAKVAVLNEYSNDTICGTWERLADAVFPGGKTALSVKGWCAIGAQKAAWAEKISPFMDVSHNASPSFGYFLKSIRELAGLVL